MSLRLKSSRSQKLNKTRTERFRAPESFLELVNEFQESSSWKHLNQDKSKLYRKLILQGLLQWAPPTMIERIHQEQARNKD